MAYSAVLRVQLVTEQEGRLVSGEDLCCALISPLQSSESSPGSERVAQVRPLKEDHSSVVDFRFPF